MSDIASSLPVKTYNNGDVVAIIADGTITSQVLGVDSSGRLTVKMQDAAGNALTSQVNGAQQALDVGINVGGVQIDPRSIRALTLADVVTANQGDPNTLANAWPVKPTDGTNSQAYTASGEAKVSVTQPLPAGTNLLGSVHARLEDDAANAITSQASGGQRALDVGIDVAGVQIDPRQVRALTSADQVTVIQGTSPWSENIAQIAGATPSATNALPAQIATAGAFVSTSNPLPVVISSALPGTPVNKYNTSAALAAGATANHDYTITAAKTFYGKLFFASASGRIKIDVQTSPDGITFTTFWSAFNSTASPNIAIELDQLVILDSGVGSKIRIVVTNEELILAQNVYSTISGTEL